MAKRKSGGGALGFVLLVGIVLLAQIPKEVWVVIAIIAAAYLLLRLFAKWQASAQTKASSAPPTVEPSLTSRQVPASTPSAPVTWARRSMEPSGSGYGIPAPPKGFGPASWIPPGRPIQLAGLTIPGGMIYVGTSLPAPSGGNDPCLIDPSKKLSKAGDFTERQTPYWPSYSEITPSARRAYLEWLAQGRRNPKADVGFVFLFFYGLERRAILDASHGEDAKADWSAIAKELQELLAVYGPASGSFRGYGTRLLEFVQLAEHRPDLYKGPFPRYVRMFEVPLLVRVALGQASAQGVPVPAPLALAWARSAADIRMRTPATRCPEQFDKMFEEKYGQAHGPGLQLTRNRTKLKFVYQPASAGFRGAREITLSFGDIPDVTVLTGPTKKLQAIVDATSADLAAYSRFVGRSPASKDSIEASLLLPFALWSGGARQALASLQKRIGSSIVTMDFKDVLDALGIKGNPQKERTSVLLRSLEASGLGIEPDTMVGARVPKADDKVVLFPLDVSEPTSRETPAYRTALLNLQLAAAGSAPDGKLGLVERNHLHHQILAMTMLGRNQQRRLMAHLQLQTVAPASLSSLKKKLDPIGQSGKAMVAKAMTNFVRAEGAPTSAEMKMLERVYKALGVNPKEVYSNVHAAATGGGTAARTGAAGGGFRLDAAKIAVLQAESEQVSGLLGDIFKEEEVPQQAEEPAEEQNGARAGVLGLDESHSNLARLILSRPQWTREELLDAAADLDLMLDGALEQINEASFDKLGLPLTEGESPITVNHEAHGKLEA